MTKKKTTKKNTRDALKPSCFLDEFFYSPTDDICSSCPFFFPCGAGKYGADFRSKVNVRGGATRARIETSMIEQRVPRKDAVTAIASIFEVTTNAASLSISRRSKKKKWSKKRGPKT